MIKEEQEDSNSNSDQKSNNGYLGVHTIESVQQFLDNQCDKANYKKLLEQDKIENDHPEDFKLLAVQNQALIQMLKSCMGEQIQLAFDDQMTLHQSQLPKVLQALTALFQTKFELGAAPTDELLEKNTEVTEITFN